MCCLRTQIGANGPQPLFCNIALEAPICNFHCVILVAQEVTQFLLSADSVVPPCPMCCLQTQIGANGPQPLFHNIALEALVTPNEHSKWLVHFFLAFVHSCSDSGPSAGLCLAWHLRQLCINQRFFFFFFFCCCISHCCTVK